eukprot:g3230.t1
MAMAVFSLLSSIAAAKTSTPFGSNAAKTSTPFGSNAGPSVKTATACSPTCPPGTGTNGQGGAPCDLAAMKDRVCGPCPSYTYNNGTSLQCQKKQCPVGSGLNGCGSCNFDAVIIPAPPVQTLRLGDSDIRDDPTSFDPRLCAKCQMGAWNNGTFAYCQPCRATCPAGRGYISVKDTQVCPVGQDFQCYGCQPGRFNDGTFLECQICTAACGPGFGIDIEIGGDKCQSFRDTKCAFGCQLLPQGPNAEMMKRIEANPPQKVKETESFYWNDGTFAFCQVCKECPAGRGSNGLNGTFCTNVNNRECGQCKDGSTYNDGTTIECRPCSTGGCGIPGRGEIRACTVRRDRQCGACPPYYWNDGHVPKCLPCIEYCPAGYGLEVACTSTHNGYCAPCPVGTWNDGYFLFCKACSATCERGSGIDYWLGGYECTTYNDAVCKFDCSMLGWFYNDGNSLLCQECKNCPAGLGQNGKNGRYCDSERNRVCGMCNEGTWNDGLSLSCRNCSTGSCPLGKGLQFGKGCTPTKDRACGACPSGWWNDGSYVNCQRCTSSCPKNYTKIASCTPWEDITCKSPAAIAAAEEDRLAYARSLEQANGYYSSADGEDSGKHKDAPQEEMVFSMGAAGFLIVLLSGGLLYTRLRANGQVRFTKSNFQTPVKDKPAKRNAHQEALAKNEDADAWLTRYSSAGRGGDKSRRQGMASIANIKRSLYRYSFEAR